MNPDAFEYRMYTEPSLGVAEAALKRAEQLLARVEIRDPVKSLFQPKLSVRIGYPGLYGAYYGISHITVDLLVQVPHRDGSGTTPLHHDVLFNLVAEPDWERTFFERVRKCLTELVTHEVDESLFVDDIRQWDPHEPPKPPRPVAIDPVPRPERGKTAREAIFDEMIKFEDLRRMALDQLVYGSASAAPFQDLSAASAEGDGRSFKNQKKRNADFLASLTRKHDRNRRFGGRP